MLDINLNPSRKELNWFGILLALFLGVVGAVIVWQFGSIRVAIGFWCAAAVTPVVYYAIPAVQRPVYLAWMYAAFPIGWIVSHVILVIVYYLVLTPIGLAMRLFGRDAMERVLDRAARSYWVERRQDADASRYFRQF